MNLAEQRPALQPVRAPYRTPKLVCFGKVQSLVQGGTFASINESGTFAFSASG